MTDLTVAVSMPEYSSNPTAKFQNAERMNAERNASNITTTIKTVKSDWLSALLIRRLIGQLTRHDRTPA